MAVAAQVALLCQDGHTVSVATAQDASRHPGQLVHVEEFALNGSSHDESAEEERYTRYLEENSFDIIIFHCWRTWPTDLAIPILPSLAARKILVSHGYASHLWHPSSFFGWGIGRWLRDIPYVSAIAQHLKSFDQTVFLSQRRDFGRFFDHRVARMVCPDRVRVIPNCASLPETTEGNVAAFRTRIIGESSVLILCVATYAPNKGQHALLRAFIDAQIKAATLLFIGNSFNAYSAYLQNLEAAAAQCSPTYGRVVFLQQLDRAQIAAAYRASDLVVLASKAETQPLVILDAMAHAKPFISTDVGCVSEMPGGIIVRGRRSMRKALMKLSSDAELRSQLGAAGRRAFEEAYSVEKVASQWRDLINRC